MTFLNIAPLTVYSASITGSYGATNASITVGRTGQYLVAFVGRQTPGGSGGNWADWTLTVAGSNVLFQIPTAVGTGVDSYAGNYWQGHCNNGDVISLSTTNPNAGTLGGGTLVAAFIPTPTERF